MIQIKKTILTLVALLAVTTGAWADVYDSGSIDLHNLKVGDILKEGVSTIESINDNDGVTFVANRYSINDVVQTSTMQGLDIFSIGVNGLIKPDPDVSFKPITEGGEAGNAWVVLNITDESYSGITWKQIHIGGINYTSASGPTVDWNKTTKTGTFTMPGGNVELEPEYYPQAALTAAPTAINDVPATTDGAILKAGTVATIGTTEQAQGTVMYYVSPTALDDAALLALAADQWKADVPTAAHLAQGQAYVYYYVRGNDSDTDDETFSDGDILAANALTVTIAAAPTYAVEFAEGTDANEWKAEPATGVKKGDKVTVTYSGAKKVIGVKAEKKSASTPLDNTTTAWSAGTFAVPAGGLTYSDAITVSGDVTLVLTDGETLTLNKGISLASGATLTVEGNGTMNVNGTNNSTASTVAGTGTLVLTSGTLNAKGGNGAGVGNSSIRTDNRANAGGNAINGNVTVSGGTLTATGGNGGGVGERSAYSYGAAGAVAISGSVTVTGGAVTATGGNGGSIGAYGMYEYGGAGGAAIGGDATIIGGTWTATDGTHGVNGDGQGGAGGQAVAGTVTDNR